MKKHIQAADERIWEWLQTKQHFVWDYCARDFSSLGGSAVIVFVAAFSTLLLWSLGQWQQALINVGAYTFGCVLMASLKTLFARPGPLPYDPWHTGFLKTAHHFPAFPSGHTCMSLLVYLTLAMLAAEQWPWVGNYLVWTAILMTLAIGVGKMYLGAHWLTDIIGGYVLGLLFVYVWLIFSETFSPLMRHI
jgi:membrane-associated phospholipid phosphatase